MTNITLPRAELQQVLEAMENFGTDWDGWHQAYMALREKLAQPEQETVREPDYWQEEARRYAGDRDYWRNRYEALVEPLTEALAQPEQEPVALIDAFGNVFPLGAQRGPKHLNEPMKPLYTAPPQRKPLTDEEIEACRQQGFAHRGLTASFDFVKAARAVEAKLKEKNT